uniref:F-box domain-containing protein n=1 Tax=Steinernema glaseri TaxID=37863 RepID=A0A1I7ZRN6_9BILA
MDYMLYDLVEEIVSYLPRPEVETIARVATRSPRLQNWSAASEDQLEHRVLLDVHVRFQGFEREENKAERSPRIHISATKRLSEETVEEWDFRNWRYAWIQNLRITTSFRDFPFGLSAPIETFKESDIDQVLRLVSLPVDPTARSCLLIVGTDSLYAPYPEMTDLLRKTIEKTRMEFAKVHVDNALKCDALEAFVVNCIERGASLKDMLYYGRSIPHRNVYEVIAPHFGKTRGRPLKVYLEQIRLGFDNIALIADTWLQSDGTFEETEVKSGGFNQQPIWPALKERYKTIVRCRNGGHLAYPTKRSSLFISSDEIRVVKFEPWHVPLDFDWLDALIEKWREGWGFYVWKGERKVHFHFKAHEDWKKLMKKYSPVLWPTGRTLLPIVHSKSPSFLEILEFDDWFEIRLTHALVTQEYLKSLISDWMKGNGETLVNGLTKIEFELKVVPKWSPTLPTSYSHPLRNLRCLISQPPNWTAAMRIVVRICIVPIDPEDVEYWNLELLFGSLQV